MEDKNFVFGLHSTIEAINAGKEIDRIDPKRIAGRIVHGSDETDQTI